MMKTNLTPSPRLIGHGCCCCIKDLLYNKATLILMIFMLPLAGFAQQNPQMTKAREVQHQEYLQSIQGNKAESQEALSAREAQTKQMSETEKLQLANQLAEQEAYQNLLLEYGINEQKYLDNGFTKADILAEIAAMDAGNQVSSTKDQTSVLSRSGGGDTCADAVVLQCDTPIFGDTFAAFAAGSPACGSSLGSNNGVWFTINGNNANNTVSLTSSSFASQILVYSSGDDTCGTLQCAGGASGQGSNSVTFFAAGDVPYWILVSGQFSFDEGTFTINRTSTAACNDTPPGDGLAPETAFPIACGDVETGDTTGFPAANTTDTTSCGPSHNSSPAVWYTFTATAGTPEDVTLTTCGYDTRMAVYSGSPGSLDCVAGNDDSSTAFCTTNIWESQVNFIADLDVTYYVKMWGYSNSLQGPYQLQMICNGDAVTPPPAAPDNDVCLDAIQLVCNETLEDQTTVAANVENTQNCGFSIGADVWYSFDGTGEQAIVEMTPIGGTAEVEIYESFGACGDFALGNCIANDTFTSSGSTLNLGVTTDANNVYFVRVAISTPTGNPFDFDITLNCPEPLVNDFCDGAIEAFCDDEITGSTVGATSQSLPSCFTSVSTAPGVWYSHIGTGEILTISTAGSNYDTKLGLYTGTCDGLVCIETNDDGGPGLTSEIEITSVLGQEYYIYVTGFSSSVGTYLLSLTCQPDPCQVATDVACGDTVTGTTVGGSTAGPSSFCGTTPGQTGVFYRYVGTDEFVTASLCNSSYDTKINVYQGSCGTLTCVGGNDDSCGSRSEFTWFAGTGEEYYIWVSGFGTATGNYEMSLTCNQPVANDLCEDAPRLSCDVIVSGSTDFATDRDKPEEDCSEFSQTIGEGVWYTLVGTGGDIRLSLCDSDFDTKLLVFTGECGDLECYTGNDDNSVCNSVQGLFRSELTMPTTAGEIYTIYVTGYTYSGGPQTGNFNLEVDCLCAPSQEGPECVTIYDGYDDPAYSSGTLTGVLDYAEEPVTYLWSTGETTQSISVDAADGSQNYSVTMTDAEGCTGSQEFFVYVMDINCDTRGTDKVEICHNGTTICVAPSAVQAHLNHGDVLGACGNLLCDEVAPLCDIAITSPADGETNVSILPVIEWTAASGLVDGYTVSIVDANAIEVVNADVGNSLSYGVSTELDLDSDYTVTVTPYNSNGGALGCNSNTFTTEAVISADGLDCDTGFNISCGQVVVASTVGFPTHDPDNQSGFCGTSTFSASPGVWYKLIGNGGSIEVTTCGAATNYDTKLNVFTGACGTLSCVGGDDDDFTCGFSSLQSVVNFSSNAGQTYYIYVHGFGTNSGTYELSVTCTGSRPGEEVTKIDDVDSLNSIDDWTMSPNPTRGNVNLELTNFLRTNVSIQVVDFTGKVITTRQLDNLQTSRYTLELSNGLPSGMYFVQLSNGESVSTKKLVIMR